jgi:hypothetical protein
VTDLNEIRAIVRSIRYRDWEFSVAEAKGAIYLQASFRVEDPETGGWVTMRSRKWLISLHSTESEIVQTALKAVLTAEEHEAREAFLYDGVALFSPHISVRAHLEIAAREDRRTS